VKRPAGLLLFGFAFVTAAAMSAPIARKAEPQTPRSSDVGASLPKMRWRMIGPFRGGRALAVSGVPSRPYEYYFGAVGGGVWRTANAGRTWQPTFDGQPIASIGAIAVAPSDRDVIYVGSGEADMRSDLSYGDGVYKSTDGGASWRNIGLRDSRHIGRILVDPRDANVVLVAAFGHAYGQNAERGVYRSTDGGATWRHVLSRDPPTGAIDLCFDPGNPRIVYAALWQARRTTWSQYPPLGGPGSGLFKSVDGGVTWAELSGNGFPSEDLGRIGIAVAPGGNRVYAVVDAKEGGIFRSDDGGTRWHRTSNDPRVWKRGWYFGGITADPRNSNIVYVPNTSLYRSTDGGAHFEGLTGAPGGNDYHSLWIASDDPARMILGSDQGVQISLDGGRSWSSWYTQPTAQFYHVSVDHQFPYHVYGTQQDSGTVMTTSRSDYGQITFRDWMPAGAEESGYILPDPSDPGIVYGGGPYGRLLRFTVLTGQSEDIAPWPQGVPGNPYHFTWSAPLAFSPQDPHVLYMAGQMVLETRDAGHSWHAASPDLTRRSTKSLEGEEHAVVFSLAPSPVRAGEIWAGTDNGFIQLTVDHGKSWTDVTPPGLAPWSRVSMIEASRFDPATAYAAVDCHRLDDLHPYLYRTRDYGKTWELITTGIAATDYAGAVREDTERRGLLFAGTELRAYVSLDDGDHWQSLELNMPVTSIRDLVVAGDDLVAATHGRSFWILDDITPLRQLNDRVPTGDAFLFRPQRAFRIRRSENHDTPLPPETPVGENPPAGAILDYSLAAQPASEVAVEIRARDGRLVRRYSSVDVPRPPDPQSAAFPSVWLVTPPRLEKTPGLHRFVWDLRYELPEALHPDYSMAAIIGQGTVPQPEGPLALPGDYDVRLIVSGHTQSQPLTLEQDPRVRVARADLEAQLALTLQIRDALVQCRKRYDEILHLREQLEAIVRSANEARAKEVLAAVDALDAKALAISGRNEEFPKESSGLVGADNVLRALLTAVGSADAAPTDQERTAFEQARRSLEAQLAAWTDIQRTDIAEVNRLLSERRMAPLAPPAPSS
jgi:photosystem II stability/assembly factor-like uncharacterized protein